MPDTGTLALPRGTVGCGMGVWRSAHLFDISHRIEMYMDTTFSCHYLSKTDSDFDSGFVAAVAVVADDVAAAGSFVVADVSADYEIVPLLVVLEIID